MAVNTAIRRWSMLGFGDAGNAHLPIPDGRIGRGDRQTLLNIYARTLAPTVVDVSVPKSLRPPDPRASEESWYRWEHDVSVIVDRLRLRVAELEARIEGL